MSDPTYSKAEIESNPIWHLAFVLSEIRNDSAPIGWGSYIPTAECLLDAFDITPKKKPNQPAAKKG